MIDRFGRGLLATSAVVAMVAATPAMAQTRTFNVPAQSAETGIAAFGRQAEIQIVAARKFTKGKKTNAVRGAMTVEAALRQLLEGTGLTFRATGAQTYMVVQGGNGDAAPARGDAPATAAQNLVTASASSVVDARTGAALKGALVEIVETGDQTSTGNLGDFRFPGKNGSFTLRISYLGYPTYEQNVELKDGRATAGILLSDGSAVNEILVTAYTSARAQALNQERTAENSSTVISADLLGNFNGTTISDALRRAPGVAFQQDDRTGDGTNIIVRGLAPDYNQIKLNGIAVPDGSGVGRAPGLNNLLADSVSEIKISKTLLPNQESTGTGGLVEIETKSPLDRPQRYFNVSVEGTKRAKGFGDEYLASGTASFRFGADSNFGLSASVQYRDQNITSFNYNMFGIYGPYLPLLANGQPATTTTLDKRTPFPFYEGADYYPAEVTVGSLNTRSKTLTASLTAEWQVSEATNLRFDYVRSDLNQTTYQNSYRIGTDSGAYRLRPVPGLNGEMRYMYFPRRLEVFPAITSIYIPDQKQVTDSFSFRGESAVDRLTLKYAAGYSKGRNSSPAYGVLSMFDDPGITLTPDEIGQGAFSSVTGNYVTLYGPRRGKGIPAPLLAPAAFERLAASPLPYLGRYSVTTDSTGGSENWSGDLSAKYDFGSGLLKYVEAGLAYRRSSFDSNPSGVVIYSPLNDPATGSPYPLDEVGIEFEPLPFSTQGGDTIYRLPTLASLRRFLGTLDQYVDDGVLERQISEPEAIYDDVGTTEEQIVGYIQARADIGKLEVIGGVRVERNKVVASSVNGSTIYDENGDLDLAFYNASRVILDGRDTSMTYLPRILLNFRPDENIVLRAGYYSTVARPQIQQLNSERFVSYYAQRRYGPTNSQPRLDVQAGNPGLKPARTHNFDVSAEWYDGNVGVIKLSAYYKRINNLLETNRIGGSSVLGDFDLPDHPLLNNLPADTFITLTYPVNNPDPATIWGIEAAVERRLTFLPGLLSGLGIYANYVYSESKKTQPLNAVVPVFDAQGNLIDFANEAYTRRLPLMQSPPHSGTIGLTYGKGGFDGSLFYTKQSRRQQGPGNFGMDFYSEAVDSLDFRGVYQFRIAGSDVRLSFEALNLLKGASDPNTSTSIGGVDGKPKYYTEGSFLGGRRFSLGFSATF